MTVPPKLVYDDDCRFCTWSATFAVRRSEVVPVRLSRVESGESRLTDEERGRLPDGYEECAQLVTEDRVYSCGAATEESLVRAGALPATLVNVLRQFRGYRRLREAAYHFLSDNRGVVAKAFGREPPVSRHVSEADLRPEKRKRPREQR